MGQNVMTMPYDGGYGFILCPAVAYVADSSGDYNYGGGISPDIEIDELEYINLNDYGSLEEVVLNAALTALLSI